MKQEELDKICPDCKGGLPFSLKKQVIGNNCGCGFPHKNQRSRWYLFKNWIYWILINQPTKVKNMKETNEIDICIEASEAERERIFTLINYILNKNSKPSGIDYKKAYEDMEELEHYLAD